MLANDTKCKRKTNDATERREQHGEPMGKEAILRNLRQSYCETNQSRWVGAEGLIGTSSLKKADMRTTLTTNKCADERKTRT